MVDRQRIIRAIESLDDSYLPDRLHGRSEQLRRITGLIARRPGRKPAANLWLYGKRGVGKTSAALMTLNHLRQRDSVPSAYVNCWQHPTLHSVVDTVNRELRILETERSETTIRLEHLRQALNARPCVVVLDEIDLAPPRHRNRIIYSLLDIPRVRLVCICGSRFPLMALEPRVKSRLKPSVVEFPPYSKTELLTIPSSRCEVSLREGSWDRKLLNTIARLAEGDARVAIQTLRAAAETTERQDPRPTSHPSLRAGAGPGQPVPAIP